MSWEIGNPAVPFIGLIPNGVRPGSTIIVDGTVSHHADRFDINLIQGKSASRGHVDEADIALHFNPRFDEGVVVVNTRHRGEWQDRHSVPSHNPIHKGSDFQVAITIEEYRFSINVNGEHFATAPHRMEFTDIGVLFINGGVEVRAIRFLEAGAGGATDVGFAAPAYYSSQMYVPDTE